jgi:hypothetical protein
VNVSRIQLAFKALRQLGLEQVGLYAWYQVTLRSGYLRWRTPIRKPPQPSGQLQIPAGSLRLPSRESLAGVLGEESRVQLLAEADEIVRGQVRLFGGPPVPLQLVPERPLVHWSEYERGAKPAGDLDIKWVWEPARFGWAYTLGRAYHLSGEERYPAAFWKYCEIFLETNPPNLGPHWVSAQEVALRLMALAFASQVFAASSHTTVQRAARLAAALGEHARRIPPTLSYARAQNNNHLLTEATGLYTAGLLLPQHPDAAHWHALGWRWLNRALQTQIGEDGAYIQQSANYQRLALQAALWVYWLNGKPGSDSTAGRNGPVFPEPTRRKLALATAWLLALLDPMSGQAPNLGPNDGAYILPLSVCPFQDYRPVMYAAAKAFLDEWQVGKSDGRPEHGLRDEMSLWFGLPGHPGPIEEGESRPSFPQAFALNPTAHTLHEPRSASWAYLRAARFDARPGHADQLHLDLWWRGLNLAQDAGTYLYNAPPPWDNALASTRVHNTLTVNGRDQMQRAGRFLFLDWAQAEIAAREKSEDGSWERLTARHYGYRRLGITHQRQVECSPGQWLVTDTLWANTTPLTPKIGALTARLHWLLPDWPWELRGRALRIHSPYGWVALEAKLDPLPGGPQVPEPLIQLARAGVLLRGEGPVSPVQGWVARTYGYKTPALSFSLSVTAKPPFSLSSRWQIPGEAAASADLPED